VCSNEASGAVVRLDNSSLDLSSSQTKEVGSTAFVCVRPEDASSVAEQVSPQANSWPATVVSTSFLGDRTRYHLDLDDGPRLYAVAPGDGEPLPAGKKVTASIQPNKVQLLSD
jgi:iron(III) transport system ATP-binding protein